MKRKRGSNKHVMRRRERKKRETSRKKKERCRRSARKCKGREENARMGVTHKECAALRRRKRKRT